MVKDPVCRKELDSKKFTQKSKYKGRTYYFCSNDCKTQFKKNPREYEVKVIIRKNKGYQ